jgi:hypothetical protein
MPFDDAPRKPADDSELGGDKKAVQRGLRERQ